MSIGEKAEGKGISIKRKGNHTARRKLRFITGRKRDVHPSKTVIIGEGCLIASTTLQRRNTK